MSTATKPRFLTYKSILDGAHVSNVVCTVSGSSLTIPGQGQDLAQIISSIVKLPPLDERTFDSAAGAEPDTRTLAVKTALDSLYPAEASNMAEDAQERQKARKKAKEEAAQEEKPAEERSDDKGDDK